MTDPTQASLRDVFLQVAPREVAGPRSSDRFAYQCDWALCQLLRLHCGGSDYLIVFDLHDDVLVFDSEADPTQLSFYQVKTRSSGKAWTRTDLLRQPKGQAGPKPSILAKLYSDKVLFPAHTKALTFVSNARITLTLANGQDTKSSTAFATKELSADDRATMATSLAKECGECAEEDLDAYLRFEVADLSLDDHEVHTRGKLGQFLESLLPEGHRTVKAGVVYKTLRDEIARRNNAKLDGLKTFDDLPRVKGFGRTGFQALLDSCGLLNDLPDLWTRIEQRLNTERMPWVRVRALRQRWMAMEAMRLDAGRASLSRVMRRIDEILSRLSGDEPDLLRDLAELVVERLRASDDDATLDYSDEDVRVLALMRAYEAAELPAADSGSTEEKQ